MAKLVDMSDNPLAEGDRCLFPPPEQLMRGKIRKVSPIIEKGPLSGGTYVEVEVVYKFSLPPGHFKLPIYYTIMPSEEKKSILEP